MNRESEAHFSLAPQETIQRSAFNRPFQHKTSFNTGDLIPIYLDEVLPGDTVSLDMSAAIRMSTPIFPVMDNAFIDFYYFFVPNRLVWEHWEEFCGANKTTYWETPTSYEIPQIVSPTGGWTKGSLADYMGIPTLVTGLSVNALPFRAYALIYNEWFRDQNTTQPAAVNMDETTITGNNGTNYVTDLQKGGMPAKAAKLHDRFTSCLPSPQKGPDVLLPIGGTTGMLPVIYGDIHNDNLKTLAKVSYFDAVEDKFKTWDKNAADLQVVNGGNLAAGNYSGGADWGLALSNLWADASGTTPGENTTINALRQAFAIQRMYEKDARGGTRYREIIKAHFGTSSPDERMQIPEYLGGTRVTINMDQVIQTSSTDAAVSPQGNAAGWSLTNMSDSMFTKSFVEHGYIIGLGVVRTEHTYQQGLEPLWNRVGRFDFYWPTLANIGEQPVYNKELYATATSTDDEAFGYQEAWSDYRYKTSRVTSTLRSNYAAGSLDSWHYADYYTQLPTLSTDWINETKSNVDRTLAVQSAVEDQFIADFYFDQKWVRPMPLYSIPGMIDHY